MNRLGEMIVEGEETSELGDRFRERHDDILAGLQGIRRVSREGSTGIGEWTLDISPRRRKFFRRQQ